ncbi:hypothetical protein JW756_04275 [Candidatus Woesearchaeota archaeon]|nr:hypothetical protein [Candidatus Woesearchaeota archaeon]
MKKAQAALEFLTTYGWAFLVILVMIGALAYFGVLSPTKILPGKCIFSPEVSCVEYQITGSTGVLEFRLRNGVGAAANFTISNVTYLGGTNPSVACSSLTLGAGRTGTVTCTFGANVFPIGEKAKFDVTILFKKTDATFWNPIKGEIYGDVQ